MSIEVDAGDFLQHVSGNPDNFFRKNIVYWIFLDNGEGMSSLSRFRVFQQDTRVRYYSTGFCGFFAGWELGGYTYEIRQDGSGDENAYFLPWKADFGYSMILRNQADLFVNALMDGCAFGCVANNGRTTVKVAHHNIQGAHGSTNHQAMTNTLSAYGYRSTVNRNQYRGLGGGAGMGMVTGLRINGAWRIYAQSCFNAHPYDHIAETRRLL